MAFRDLQPLPQGVALLQRSLECGRLGHAYLLAGEHLETLEDLAKTLAKTLNCQAPPRRAANGLPLDCCDACDSCRKTADDRHPDVRWLRPESKLRLILADQIRTLLESVYLRAAGGAYKVAVIVGADRMNATAANAFLKTLEEPPPRCVLLLLTTEPTRVLETITSRCLRLTFGTLGARRDPELVRWLRGFSEQAAAPQGGLLARYRLLDDLLGILVTRRAGIEKDLTTRSPLQRYEDIEPDLREQWDGELAAAIEAEYRRQRGDLLAAVQWWLRDVWLATQGLAEGRLNLPELAGVTDLVARRITPAAAAANLAAIERTQRLLGGTNVQEALTLEVGLLRLQL